MQPPQRFLEARHANRLRRNAQTLRIGFGLLSRHRELFEEAPGPFSRPNVEVTGAARLYRATSSDRRERGRSQG